VEVGPQGAGAALAPASATATAPPPLSRSFTVVATGDVLLHRGLWAQASRDAGGSGYDFAPLFGSVRPVIAGADLAICHLETPVGPPSGPFSGFPLFSVPPQIAPALASTGYDSCSTASNHSVDQGERGVARTLEALDAAHIAHSGTARSAEETRRLNMLMVKGVTVAHLSYSYGFNGLVRPRGKEYLANQFEAGDVLAEAERAKLAGAEVVIVSLHWGTEYQHEPNAQQTSLAKKLLASPDIDLILGHHAHVVQPLNGIGDKWVAYGMGNMVSWQDFARDTTDGIMPEFTFSELSPGVFRVSSVEVRAVHMWLNQPARVYDIAAVLSTLDAPAALTQACRASLRRTQRVLGTVDGMVLAG
jgi:poly-gamma-glutamate synthesis protein (capsule biosynthesis protein)